MRTRPVLALAMLATALGAPAFAAQRAAKEVKFVESWEDEYDWSPGRAVRFTSRVGGLYAVRPELLLIDSMTPSGVIAFYGNPLFPPDAAVAASTIFCFSSTFCKLATAINQAGRIVGSEYYFYPGGQLTRPYESRVDPQTGTVLELEYLTKPPGFPLISFGTPAYATAINDADVIAGWATSGIPAVGLAPIWWTSPLAVAQELPRIPGLDAGPFPVRINTAGVIVGNTAGSAPVRAAVWRPTYTGYELALLGELPGGTTSRVYDIGFFGGIVGRSDDGTATPTAVVWKWSGPGYSVTPLPVPEDGSCSAATAINTNGDIAGNCTFEGGAERGVVWRKVAGSYELLHELLPLPGHDRSVAWALDDDGQAGGGSGPANAERAVVWPVVAEAPVQVPALSHLSLLCLASVMAVAAAVSLRR